MTLANMHNPVVMNRDPRLDRCKVFMVPMAAFVQMLNADGETVPKVEGWTEPEDEGVILGWTLTQVGTALCMAITVHSPRFPLVLQQPPVVPVSGEWRHLPDGLGWDDLPHEDEPDD